MPQAAVEHTPVLVAEVLAALKVRPDGTYVDATVGGGGHSHAILQLLGPEGLLIGLDRDASALAAAEARLQGARARVVLVRENFVRLGEVVRRAGVEAVDGVLFDLGLSGFQVDVPARGFSYRQDAPLDMRMDPTQETTAADLVNRLPEKELARLLVSYGEERWARRIARVIVAARRRRPIQSTAELASLVKVAIPAAARRRGPHPARRTFQALRIAVNQELDDLRAGLEQAAAVLAGGGRLAVISFHSLEDRIVKEFFRAKSGGCTCPPKLPVCVCGAAAELRVITRRPLRPRPAEVARNPRARSARLRVAEKSGSREAGE